MSDNGTTRRTISSVLVAWCPHAEAYVPDQEEIGASCFMCERDHKTHKRRGYICPDCELLNVFFSRAEFLDHRCGEITSDEA